MGFLSDKIVELHQQEDAYNKEVSDINKQINKLTDRKAHLQKLISKNMNFRNKMSSSIKSSETEEVSNALNSYRLNKHKSYNK